MRSLMITLLLLATGGGYALAQVPTSPRPAAKSVLPTSKAAAKIENEQAVANCVQMWDHGTHMTKEQWLRTCRRVQNRLQNLQTYR